MTSFGKSQLDSKMNILEKLPRDIMEHTLKFWRRPVHPTARMIKGLRRHLIDDYPHPVLLYKHPDLMTHCNTVWEVVWREDYYVHVSFART